MFEIVYDGRRTDGRRIHGYPISSPMSQGSGELKITGKTASGFLLFWQNTGPKKPVNEPSPLKSQYFEFKCKFNSILIQANINIVDCISMNKWQ